MLSPAPHESASPLDPDIERSVNYKELKKRIDNYLHKIGLTSRIIHNDNKLQATIVALENAQKKVVIVASGKGRHHFWGAHSEAIERFITANYQPQYDEHYSLGDIARQPCFQRDVYMHTILAESPDSAEVCIRTAVLRSLTDNTDIIVPGGYLDPYFFEKEDIVASLGNTEKKLAKLATANGISVGLTLNDAVLHGLNEAIERHYASLFYEGLLGYSQPVTINWQLYDNENNAAYRTKRNGIKEKFGGSKIITIYTRTEFGSYVAFSILMGKKDKEDMTLIGEGSSVFMLRAIQRSIDELAEALVLQKNGRNDKPAFNKAYHTLINYYKKLWPVLDIPEERVMPLVKNNPINHTEDRPLPVDTTPSDQLGYLAKNLKKHNYKPGYRILSSENNVWTVHTFVPGFNPFFLIRKGVLLAPRPEYMLNVSCV